MPGLEPGISQNGHLSKRSEKFAYHFEFFFHGPGDVDGFLFHVFDGEHPTFVYAHRGEYRRVPEIRVRV